MFVWGMEPGGRNSASPKFGEVVPMSGHQKRGLLVPRPLFV